MQGAISAGEWGRGGGGSGVGGGRDKIWEGGKQGASLSASGVVGRVVPGVSGGADDDEGDSQLRKCPWGGGGRLRAKKDTEEGNPALLSVFFFLSGLSPRSILQAY